MDQRWRHVPSVERVTDEELRDLRRAVASGEEGALEVLGAYVRRELASFDVPLVMVAYRARDREEYWRLRRVDWRAGSGVDVDGLAPHEDPRRALEIVDARLVRVWHGVDFTFARIRVPAFSRSAMDSTFVEAVRSEAAWPDPMGPCEYMEWRA